MLSFLNPLKQYEPIVWAVGLVAVLIGALALIHHIEAIGARDELAKVEAARAEEHVKVQAETARLQAAADKAAGDRDEKQHELEVYMASHPVGVIRVCDHARSGSNVGLPTVASSNGATSDSGAGPVVVPSVLSGTEGEGSGGGPDVGPEVDTLVRAAATVAGLYRQSQQQPTPKVK